MILKITSAGNVISPAGPRPDRREIGRVLRFVVIGFACTAIDFATYLLLAGAVSPPMAKALSYVGGMLLGFAGNKFWTFGSRRQSLSEPAIYIALYTCTLGVNVAV